MRYTVKLLCITPKSGRVARFEDRKYVGAIQFDDNTLNGEIQNDLFLYRTSPGIFHSKYNLDPYKPPA